MMPIFVLVEPQLGENIGAVARAMANFGAKELRIVNPREAWPNERAYETAKHASSLLDNATLYTSTEEAVADGHILYATSARRRDMAKPSFSPREAAQSMKANHDHHQKVMILFGPERTGLINEDIVLADAILSIPVSPLYPSLNLAQSVAIIGYEWFLLEQNKHEEKSVPQNKKASPATARDLLSLFHHLEEELDHSGFFSTPQIKQHMIKNMRNVLKRACLSYAEIQTFRGVIRSLSHPFSPRL